MPRPTTPIRLLVCTGGWTALGVSLPQEEAEAADCEAHSHQAKACAYPCQKGSLGCEIDSGILLDSFIHDRIVKKNHAHRSRWFLYAQRLAMIDAALPESLWPPLPLQPHHCRRCTISSRQEECSRAPAFPTSFGAGNWRWRRPWRRALEEHHHLIVEAGTGTGKTLAYLLPALRTGQRIIISTGTKNLQEQLFFQDVPFLESLLGRLRVCYMKGRANYLCRHKLFALRDQPILSGLEEIDQYHQIAEWEKTTETGDRAEIDALPESSALWAQARRAQRGLPRVHLSRLRALLHHRDAAQGARVRHHHRQSPSLLRRPRRQAAGQAAPDAGVLPEAAAVIFDEAHELEEVASSYFGISLSNVRFEELARDTETMLRGKKAYSSGLQAAVEMLRERARMFFAGVAARPAMAACRSSDAKSSLKTMATSTSARANALHRLEGELDRTRGVEEAPGLRKRVGDIREHLRFLLESDDRNTVFWIERRSAGGMRSAMRNTYLQATPIDVSELLGELLFENYPTVVLTSATLTVQGGFDHMRKRLGMREARELVVPSHFRYGEQALLYLPPEMPDPRDAEFQAEAAKRIRRVLEHYQGPRLLPLHQLHADARALRAPALGARLSLPAARHRAAQGAAGGVPQHAQCRALRHLQLLAGSGRAGRSAELRHHRPPALCRAHRSRGRRPA